MPHSVDWLDEDRRILAVRLYDPLTAEDTNALHSQLTPIVESGLPLFVLADIREIDLMQAYSGLSTALNGLSLPTVSDEQRRQSRLAIVGGGTLINTVLSIVQNSTEQDDLLRAFKYEDKAFAWLEEASRSGFIPSF